LAASFLSLLVALPTSSFAEEDTPKQLGEEPLVSFKGLEYRPGRGLRVGETGFVVGGFTNIKFETTDESGEEFSLDLLNFFLIFDHFTRFRAVAELQLKDIFTADNDHSGAFDFAFDVRRLFGDFTLYDELRLRGGTFLTPIGYWNLVLATPLTWTTEPPLIVEETFFEQTTTGAMLHGSTGLAGGQFGYSVFTQFLDPLEDDPELKPPDNTAGLRFTYDMGPTWSIGTSYQSADTDDRWTHMVAAHVHWQLSRGEIISEIYFQDGDDLIERDEDEVERFKAQQWGTYLEGVFEIYHPIYLVGRYEHYDPPSPDSSVNVFTFGGVVKPFPFMALKAEYRFSDKDFEDEDLDGFFFSFTTFF
jgi:hypothetical protein